MTLRLLVAFILLASFCFPFRFYLGLPYKLSLFEISIIIGLMFCSVTWIHSGKVYLGNRLATYCLAILTLLPLLSFLWSENKMLTGYYVIYSLESFIVYILTINLMRGLGLKKIMALFSMIPALLLLGAFLSYIRMPGFLPDTNSLNVERGMEIIYITTYYARLSHPFFGLSNNFAAVLALFMLPIYAYYIVSSKKIYLFMASIILAGTLATLSRGVLIPLILSLVFLNYYISSRNYRNFTRTSFLIPLAVLPAIIYATRDSLVNKYLADRLESETFNERLDLMKISLSEITLRPFLGVGAGVQINGLEKLNSHNSYLDQLVYYGIPLGLLAIVCITLISMQFSIRYRSYGEKVIIISMITSLSCQYLIFASQSTFEVNLKIAFFIAVGFYISIYYSLKKEVPL